ncbi:PKD domain-containing protein [Methyloterricola oryzae]|uniref:PKD domain-containing protein n=1 Tax=Methyloterricola oryzae TaxID=1495050 RepID=UPI00130104C5|nr:hypothetical protein [Methyloterricola oryzae]
MLTALALFDASAQAGGLDIKSASWSATYKRLTISGEADDRATVTLFSVATGRQIANVTASSGGDWRVTINQPATVPCRVRAVSNGDTDESRVSNAPSNCDSAPANQLPTASAGPDQVLMLANEMGTVSVSLDGSGSSDPDGSIATYTWTGTPDPADVVNPTLNLSAGQYVFSLVVTDDKGGRSSADTVRISVNAPPPPSPSPTPTPTPSPTATPEPTATPLPSSTPQPTASPSPSPSPTASPSPSPSPTPAAVSCSPVPTDGKTAHAECIQNYTGPEVCVTCHEKQARDMHGSVHYQQGGAFPNVTNIPANFARAGKHPAKAAGELVADGLNTYCGSPTTSPRFTCANCHVGNGRFPMAQSEFEKLPLGSEEAHKQLSNVDCMTCHQEVYKRFPNPAAGYFENMVLENVVEDQNGILSAALTGQVTRVGLKGIPVLDQVTKDFQFVPADPTNPELAGMPTAKMPITALEAARTVHPTTRKSCLSCHAGAAGANGAKRGDLSTALISPPVEMDVHMSPAGANQTCSTCHNAPGDKGEGHRVRGRGLDLRANDVSARFTCDSAGCHSNRPHGDYSATTGSSRDKHAMKVACQTCHIPTYAKVVNGVGIATEILRDWQTPQVSQTACNGRGGWLPKVEEGSNLVPTYEWFDGTSRVYYIGEVLHGGPAGDVPTKVLPSAVATSLGTTSAAYVLGAPNGGVASSAAKLYPMKEHWGKLARHKATDTLVAHSTFEFFRTGDFDTAVRNGMANTPGMASTDDYEVVPVHTYQTINHGVDSSSSALACGACHSALTGGPVRMDLKGKLGYGLRTGASAVQGTRQATLDGTFNTVCRQCHSVESSGRTFTSVHSRHVQDKRKDCAACHNFSRPERGLSLSSG